MNREPLAPPPSIADPPSPDGLADVKPPLDIRSPRDAPPESQRSVGGPFVSAPISAAPDRSAEQPASDTQEPPIFDLSKPNDVARIQQRLIELKYLAGAADGVWGPKSKQALQHFRSLNQLGREYAWDDVTQQQLFSAGATAAPSLGTYVGHWSADPSQCSNDLGPLEIMAGRAQANGTACEFSSVKQEGDRTWRVQARCSSQVSTWIANIKLALSSTNSQLTWRSKKGTATYHRCSP